MLLLSTDQCCQEYSKHWIISITLALDVSNAIVTLAALLMRLSLTNLLWNAVLLVFVFISRQLLDATTGSRAPNLVYIIRALLMLIRQYMHV